MAATRTIPIIMIGLGDPVRSARPGGGLAAAWARGVQAGPAGELASYLKVCAMLVPREMKLEHSGGIKAMTDEQIERSIEFIKEQLARREAGANAKVIEGVGEPVAALPPPSRKAQGAKERPSRQRPCG